MFDNSQNHHKKSPDGLCANSLNLGDGGKNTPTLRNGWYIVDGQRVEFNMQNEHGIQKGLKSILQDRQKWSPDLKLECKDHIEADAAAAARGELPSSSCCARRRVANEPDFLAQREWLREVVEDKGHCVLYFPKFHCELNYIEMVWAYVKARLRRICVFSIHALRESLPIELDTIPVAFFRRAARHCLRFMSGYRKGLTGLLLDYTQRKYKGHRAIPNFVLTDLEREYNEHREKLNKKRKFN
jgi:hypothetical protein